MEYKDLDSAQLQTMDSAKKLCNFSWDCLSDQQKSNLSQSDFNKTSFPFFSQKILDYILEENSTQQVRERAVMMSTEDTVVDPDMFKPPSKENAVTSKDQKSSTVNFLRDGKQMSFPGPLKEGYQNKTSQLDFGQGALLQDISGSLSQKRSSPWWGKNAAQPLENTENKTDKVFADVMKSMDDAKGAMERLAEHLIKDLRSPEEIRQDVLERIAKSFFEKADFYEKESGLMASPALSMDFVSAQKAKTLSGPLEINTSNDHKPTLG